MGGGALLGSLALEQGAWGLLRRRHNVNDPTGVGSLLDYVPLDGSDATLLLVRREDFVRLQLDLFNIELSGNSLKVKSGSKPAYLVYTFAPQHVAEQAYLSDTPTAQSNSVPNSLAGPGGAQARLAGPSRLAFSVSGADLPGLTLAELLALPWAPVHAPLAQAPSGVAVAEFAEPAPTQTAIELPWHLVLTPDSGVFQTPLGQRLSNGRAELWTARLAQEEGSELVEGGFVRAPWTYDVGTQWFFGNANSIVGPNAPQPTAALPGSADTSDEQFAVEQSLSMYDRWNIAHATNDATLGPSRAAVGASRLWLSARGGHFDASGTWALPSSSPASALRQWRHSTTAARDHYVKVVNNGFLFPFGHRATVTIVSERAFQRAASEQGPTVARFRQYAYITLLEPTRGYGNLLDFPFTSLTITTNRTPAIEAVQVAPSSNKKAPAGVSNPPPTSYTDGWVPYLSGSPFRFTMVGTDWAGRQITFTASAMFVLQPAAQNDPGPYINAYNALAATDPIR
jgi:hypothetical protein